MNLSIRLLNAHILASAHVRIPRPHGRRSSLQVAAVMGHSRSHLVDQVYAHSLQSGMASVAERVTARALGEQPKLRVVDNKTPPDIRQPLDVLPSEPILSAQLVDSVAPPAGVEPTTYRLGGGRSIH